MPDFENRGKDPRVRAKATSRTWKVEEMPSSLKPLGRDT